MRLATIFGAFSPPWFVKGLAFFLSSFAFLCLKRQRQRVVRNLFYINQVNQKGQPFRNAKRETFHLFQNFGLGIAHFLQSPYLVDKILPNCELNLTTLRQAQKKGKAVLLVTAHFGNWELAGILLKRLGFPLSVIVEPLGGGLFATYNYYRERFGVEVIPYDQPKKLLRAIERKRVIVFLADRSLTGKGVAVSFFGKKRVFPKGPAFFALKYGLPIVPGYILLTTPPLFSQDKRGRYLYRVVTEDEVSFLPSGNFAEDVIRLTEIIAKRIEGWVSAEPTQWFVFEAEWQDEK